MVIDKGISTPLYQQVKNYLEDKIASGEWFPGYRLPAEKELAALFQVSNITAKRAILDLVNDGILHRQSGKGTFVKQPLEQDLTKLVSIQDDEGNSQLHPHKTLTFKTAQAGERIGGKLGIQRDEEVYMVHRLKVENDKPTVIEYSFVPVKLTPDLSQYDIENELLYNIYSRKYGMILDKAKVYISTMSAEKYEASQLGIPPGEPLFVLERFTTTNKKVIIEYSKFIMNFENAKFYLEVQL
ncbi:GntR family transcriptional regulator [Virgibacillus natechei]